MSGSITAPELFKCKAASIKTDGQDGMVTLVVHVPLRGFLEQYLNLQSAGKSQTSQVFPFAGDVWDLSVANPVKGEQMFQPQQPYPGWGAPPMWQQPQYRPPDDGGIQNVRTVANEAEARQCVCPLGSRVLLMDASEPRFYVKETDFNNVSTVRAYEFHEASSAPKRSEYITREEFEEWKASHEPVVQPEADEAAAGHAAAVPDDGPVHTRAGEGGGGAHRR